MKALNSWITAVVTCSAMVGQANADVFMLASGDGGRGVNAVANLKLFDRAGHAPVDNQRESSQVRPVFVPGSLIDKASTASKLMAQSVRRENAAVSQKVSLIQLAGCRGHQITPIQPVGAETRPISTFAQFVQLFESAPGSHDGRDAVLAMDGDDDEIIPKTSNMTLIGLFAFSLAGITAVISASRRGFFGPTEHQRRSRMF